MLMEEQRINDLLAHAAELKDDEGLNPDTYEKLEQAIESMRVMMVPGGGGGPGSVRGCLAQLIALQQSAARQHRTSRRWTPPEAPVAGVAVALYPFSAQNDRELSFRSGDMLAVQSVEAPAGWLYASSSAGAGLVPKSYVEFRVQIPGDAVKASGEQIELERKDERRRALEPPSDQEAADHLGIGVEEWRALPAHLKPKHLTEPSSSLRKAPASRMPWRVTGRGSALQDHTG